MEVAIKEFKSISYFNYPTALFNTYLKKDEKEEEDRC